MSAAVLCLAVCVVNAVNKASMCGTVSQPFSAFHWKRENKHCCTLRSANLELKKKKVLLWRKYYMGGASQATVRFQDSDIFQKAIKMALRCILGMNSHLSGFKL